MIPGLPFYINLFFILTTFLTVWIFYRASRYSTVVLLVISCWLALQFFLSLSGFYLVTDGIPPRFMLLPAPALLFIIALFLTEKGRRFIDKLDSVSLTWIHAVRVPVELCLFWLYLNSQIPQVMTFEGHNFDILSGITAPLIVWFGYKQVRMNKTWLLAWNFVCLALLFNIVIHAALAAPFDFQQIAFDQPNVAILYFPFVWLPCCVVPLVLLSHLACIRQLLRSKVVLPANEGG